VNLGGVALAEPVRALAFDSNASSFLTGGDDKTARVWDLQGGRLMHSWCAMPSVSHLTLKRVLAAPAWQSGRM
jgi:WD40 repeat protein